MSTGKHSDRVDQAVRAVPPLSHLFFFLAPTPRSERLEQAFRALTGDIFCCTLCQLCQKKLLYIISFSARVSLALLSLR